METKRLIVLMLAGMLLILGWQPFISSVARMLGYELRAPATTTQPVSSTTTAPANLPVNSVVPGNPSPTVGTTQQSGGWSVPSTQPIAEVVRLGSGTREDQTFAIELSVSPRGAGVEQVILNDYYLSLRDKKPFVFEQPATNFEERTRPLALRGLNIDGVEVDLTGATWTQTAYDSSSTNATVTYELPVERSGAVELVLRRTYSVFPRTAERLDANDQDSGPRGFEIRLIETIVNRSAQPKLVALRYNAPGVPPTEAERYADGNYIVGYATDGRVSAVQHMTDSVKEFTDFFSDRKEQTPYYFGAATTYFLSLQRFEPVPGGTSPVDWFDGVTAKTLTPEAWGALRRNEVVVKTKPIKVEPGAEGKIASRVYFGPRKREILTNKYFASAWIQFDRSLVIISGICGICTWQWLIDLLFMILKAFHTVTRDWGLAIIGLVILVRLVLHPISKKAQLNMLKFGKLAPEMERIKKRYADDQETMNREMMKFYREHGSTQLMGCLPMFLQMPVWIALWQAMNTTFDLRHQPFLYGLTWISDLSKPDHLIDFASFGWPPFHLPLLSFIVISGINVLPLLFGVLQFIQFKIQPKPPTMTPEQEQQQKMTQWMILIMMPVLLYASPSGLMIYMITSFILGIIESKLVKKQFEQMTQNEARFTVVDDGSPAAATAVKATVRRAEPKKKGLRAMIDEARQRAAEMQKEIEKNRKKR